MANSLGSLSSRDSRSLWRSGSSSVLLPRDRGDSSPAICLLRLGATGVAMLGGRRLGLGLETWQVQGRDCRAKPTVRKWNGHIVSRVAQGANSCQKVPSTSLAFESPHTLVSYLRRGGVERSVRAQQWAGSRRRANQKPKTWYQSSSNVALARHTGDAWLEGVWNR